MVVLLPPLLHHLLSAGLLVCAAAGLLLPPPHIEPVAAAAAATVCAGENVLLVAFLLYDNLSNICVQQCWIGVGSTYERSADAGAVITASVHLR